MPKKSADLISAIQDTADQALDQRVLLSLVGYNLKRAYLSIMPVFEKRMAKYELRPVDFTVLSLLKANPNIQQKRLSAAINVSPPNLATLLDKLEGRHLIQRQRNPLDKRSQTLVLTEDGARLCDKAEKTASDLEIAASNKLTVAERAELIRLLQKIA
ncbi:MarR family winged helix-turn-helix transcriptional regulator [Pseudoduganella namucuonensis]|uniref:DNA-binding transcriptional regulator, MarR family n=1 Tax=Pseudoduganella namucuonensis TaxID=1035707 RepID=A0A1I7L7J6_9BURK|nr:MarR family transcriptional regulator [Pseudoduganella namucuonensis]SFV05673.1 DNA-binding transcriptional regulator, MarR family [Pseudoduganella namucuonensis]